MTKRDDGDMPEFDTSTFLQAVKEQCLIDDFIRYQNLKDRHIYFTGDIDTYNASDTIQQIIRYNKEDAGIAPENRTPILLFISSDGGDVTAGFQIIDVIQQSETPVYTVNTSCCYSMAAIVFMAGHKRFAMKNSSFLIHDGSSGVYNSSGKVQDTMQFLNKLELRMKDFILANSSIPEKEYKKKMREEWYMFADEAKEKKVTDYIIGEDVKMGEII